MRVLITGTAGFIGFHVARRFLSEGHAVLGIDGITPYYDQRLKRRRLYLLEQQPNFTARELMLENLAGLKEAVAEAHAELVIHLAAQAGVRYSVENPRAFIDSNVVGTFNLLEALRQHPCAHLLLASTSSVYGANRERPFRETHCADQPLSIYAASKKATEAIAHSHSHLTGLPVTVMRLFTVYGPWGRPDMALFKFTRNILNGLPIDVYGSGQTRDFTYIDDIMEGIVRLARSIPAKDSKTDAALDSREAPYRIVNIGSGHPIALDDFIATIEAAVGRQATRNPMPAQPGDVSATYASTDRLFALTGFRPRTPLAEGVRAFVDWYRDYTADTPIDASAG